MVLERLGLGRLRLVVVLTMLVVLTSATGTTLALTRPPLSSAETALARRPVLADDAGVAAVAVAADTVRRALSFDHRGLGPGLRVATATMTGPFAHTFADAFRRSVAPGARRGHAVSKATVQGAGLVRAHEGRAVVLVVVDQRRRGDATGAEGDLTSWRLSVDLTWTGGDTDGEWRVDGIRAL